MRFNLVTNKTTELASVCGFSGGNNELRNAGFGFVSRIDCALDAIVDDAFPGLESIVVKDFQKTFAYIGGAELQAI